MGVSPEDFTAAKAAEEAGKVLSPAQQEANEAAILRIREQFGLTRKMSPSTVPDRVQAPLMENLRRLASVGGFLLWRGSAIDFFNPSIVYQLHEEAVDLRTRYRDELRKLKGAPENARIATEKRFLLVKRFLDVYEPRQKMKLRRLYRLTKSRIEFGSKNGIGALALSKWIESYRQSGIGGLVPKYWKIIWEDDGSFRVEYRRKSTRGVRKYTPPRFMQVKVDAKVPLRGLESLLDAVLAEPTISPRKKDAFKRLVSWDLQFIRRNKMLELCRSLSPDETEELLRFQRGNDKHKAAKARAILMMSEKRYYLFEIVRATAAGASTILRWTRDFTKGGLTFIESPYDSLDFASRRERKRSGVIEIIHSPPNAYGINRTSWTFETIAKAYASTHQVRVSREDLRKIIKESGYTWQHARKVLTSTDPEYRKKVNRVLEVLQNLKADELFFFVDEAGPWRVKKYGGVALSPRGKPNEVPEDQQPRGIVKFIAALEATTNQLTWFFTNRRTAGVMCNLFERLRKVHPNCPKFYVTWDSLSSHRAKDVDEWLKATNGSGVGAYIEIVPLPSKSQFLNVIEAVFSTTRRAVIHNSDYPSKEAMEEAISRHFEERNEFYKENPRRAGSKIWDKTAFKAEELPGGLFRKM